MRINSTRTGIWKHSTFYFGFKIKHMFHFTAWQSHKYDNQNKRPSTVVYTSLCCKYSLDLCEMEIIFRKQGRKCLRFNDIVLLLDIDDMLGVLSRKILLTIYYMYFPCFKICLHNGTKYFFLLNWGVSLSLSLCKL